MTTAVNGDINSGRSETDRISALELQSNRRILYFSDGCMEELSSSDSDAEPDVPDKGYDDQLQRDMALMPRLRYKASRMGNNILAGIDYVGGGIASFLGITNSKYASEQKYHKRDKEQDENEGGGGEGGATTDEDLDNWQSHNNNRNQTIVNTAPNRQEHSGMGSGTTPSRQ